MGYAVWVAALVHGIAAGTDAGSPFAIAAYSGAAGVVALASLYRVGAVRRRNRSAVAAR